MSVFSNLFGSSEKQNNSNSKINWIPLQDLGQLNEIINISNEKPVVIFKHSTRCIVSRTALKQFEIETLQCNVFTENNVATYFLDLLAHRDISNEIANRFGVQHQSPQLLLIKEGKSVYDVSHSDIDAAELKVKL
ncbi:bacillithiol system redox-active protein YtxJ [Flavobacterium nackdongense]|uniref:Bacillithiol system redox-active protein YtxJ n=1 Tax=Flavobacterium nackdongense TaxID=2547394 RepID=A0A4P6YBL5_9FLAO|nr:bacillithiol system redox-active protein YtxJ [Flavobacterium nackdongense]QBN18055.1 bacillithiol system redox-active protein YtxJ [Flavobacterium nackdongense]